MSFVISNLISVEQVTSGTILLEAKFGNFPAFKGAFDWCDVVKDLAPCPTKPGTYSKSATIDIMATLPSVSLFAAALIEYTVHVYYCNFEHWCMYMVNMRR